RGTALRALARYGEAIASLDNARALAQAMSINVLESRLLKELAQLHAARGDHRLAWEYAERSAALYEEHAQRTQRLALSEAQSRFDLMTTRNDAARLENELAWQRERLRQQRYTLALGAVAVALSLVLLAILVGQYLRVRRINRALRSETVELERASNLDALTGIHNRRFLEARLSAWSREA